MVTESSQFASDKIGFPNDLFTLEILETSDKFDGIGVRNTFCSLFGRVLHEKRPLVIPSSDVE